MSNPSESKEDSDMNTVNLNSTISKHDLSLLEPNISILEGDDEL
jgi:hypothetical protein